MKLSMSLVPHAPLRNSFSITQAFAIKVRLSSLLGRFIRTDRLLKSLTFLQKPLMVAFMKIPQQHTLATTTPSTVPRFLSEATATAPSFSFSLRHGI